MPWISGHSPGPRRCSRCITRADKFCWKARGSTSDLACWLSLWLSCSVCLPLWWNRDIRWGVWPSSTLSQNRGLMPTEGCHGGSPPYGGVGNPHRSQTANLLPPLTMCIQHQCLGKFLQRHQSHPINYSVDVPPCSNVIQCLTPSSCHCSRLQMNKQQQASRYGVPC